MPTHIEVQLPSDHAVIALCGGSCSGKTTLVKHLAANVDCTLLLQDNYYHDNGGAAQGEKPNFDHPDSIDFDLFSHHLRALKQGERIDSPQYDFVTHRRTTSVQPIESSPLIVVEGILILQDARLRALFDYAIFTDCDEITRKTRRLSRDIKERGRTETSVIQQFESQVAPMHRQFVEPSKAFADEVFNQEDCTQELQGKRSRLLEICEQLAGPNAKRAFSGALSR